MKVNRNDLEFSIWDLLQTDDEYFLVLGDDVSFVEQYTARFPENRKLTMIYPKFVSKKYVKLIHWMVNQYYSTYKNVVRYFISKDIESLLKKESNKKPKWLKNLQLDPKLFGVDELAEKWQTLIVYPDMWTMCMMVDQSVRNESGVLFLSSLDTQAKKDKAFWQVKKWLVKYILVSHAELFQDFHDLKSIILVHPYKWYYANQQDPRYKTPEILAYLSNIWKIKLTEI